MDFGTAGCAACRYFWPAGGRPAPLGVSYSQHATLYQCPACRTYWAEFERYAVPLTPGQARADFADVFARTEHVLSRVLSRAVADAVRLALADGNAASDVSEGWSRARQVVAMRDPLTPALRARIARELPGLRYWSAPGTPHDAPAEGFVDDAGSAGITFPAPARGPA